MESIPQTMVISGDFSCDMSDLRNETIATRGTAGGEGWRRSAQEISASSGRRFSSIGGSARGTPLRGRTEETDKIRKCFAEVASKGPAQLLLVAGVSGSGKSTLVEHMRDFVTSPERRGFFCEGKFEQSILQGATHEPFRAFANAFSDVIDFILNQGDRLHERSKAVSTTLGSDASLLVDIVPNLSLLLGAAAQNDIEPNLNSGASSKAGAASSKASNTHLAILFRNFLRSLTSKDAPILLFLDDLQFADSDSLDVFRALTTDSCLKHVLIVGTLRSNEMPVSRLLHPAGGPKAAASSALPTTVVSVGDLDLRAINAGLAEKLRLPEEITQPLSQVVLHKSGGNPFHVTQYLKMLQENQLLVYSEEDERWTWDIEEISMMTNVSNNVLELVSQRLQKLPDEIRSLLTLIAFVGFRFELELVEMILRQLAGAGASCSSNTYRLESQCVVDKALSLLHNCTTPSQNLAVINNALQKAVEDGLVEKCSEVLFKFTHDRIQQALYEMVKADSARSELHYFIGDAVSSMIMCDIEERRASLFFIADQLNRGISHITKEEELIKLAETNLKVGKAAAARAGYQSAVVYLRSAMKLLKDVKYWETHYSLMIDLCSTNAEIEAKMSNFDRSRELCDLVLQRASSLDDKVRAYVCLVSSYCTQESLDDAVRVGREYLAQVGVKLPKHATLAHVVVNDIQTKKCMHKVNDDMILESPWMSDNKMAKAIEVLNTLATAYYLMDAGEMMVIIVMRMVQLTRRFGLAETTAKGFAFYGLLSSSLGNCKQALRYGNLALALMRSSGHENKVVEASVLNIVYTFVMWWKIPLQECTKPLLRGLNAGKQQGDLEFAYFSGLGAIESMFHCGHNLHETLKVAQELCGEMVEYEVHSAASMAFPYWQIVENLTGLSYSTYKLTGSAMDEDEMVRKAEETKNLHALQTINSLRLCAAVIFQKWDLAAELAFLVVKGIKNFNAHFWGFSVRLYLGLTYSERYLCHCKRTDLRRLLKITRELKHWQNVGVANCKPLYYILQAELAATKRRNPHADEAKALCDKAIEECHNQNLMHYQAIASERAMRICQLNQDKQGALGFLGYAEDCYLDWGADAKVDDMERMYSRLRYSR